MWCWLELKLRGVWAQGDSWGVRRVTVSGEALASLGLGHEKPFLIAHSSIPRPGMSGGTTKLLPNGVCF